MIDFREKSEITIDRLNPRGYIIGVPITTQNTMNAKQKFLATLLGVSLTLAVVIPNRTLTNSRGNLATKTNTEINTPAPTPTPTPSPGSEWICPHDSQIKLTPTGQSDPVCVYKMGTIGNQIRTEMYEHYHGYRRILTKEGRTPKEIEAALYLVDLEIMARIRDGI